MKKSVIILIALIYVASVALVSFFGLQFKVFEEVISVEKVEITNEGQKNNEQLGDYVVIYPNEKGEWRYQIQYHVYPDNATNSAVDFIYDTQTPGVTVDAATGLITFERKGALTVTLKPKDGSNISATLTIRAR